MLYKRCDCADPSKCLHPFSYVFELHGRRYRRSTRTATVRLAERIEGRRRNEVLEGKAGIVTPRLVKLSAHVDDYVLHTAKTNTTSYKDRDVLDRLQTVIGDRLLGEINPFHIESWKSKRSESVSKSTVNRELNIVRGCFSRAVEWGVLAVSPAKGVDNYRVDDSRIRVLNDVELSTVLEIDDPFVTTICRATLESLARLSELLGLHSSHIGASWVELRRKGGSIDRIPVTSTLRGTLLARCHDSGYVFGEGKAGKPPMQQTATNRVIRALQAAKVLDASHHTMRHTGVTIMLEKGVNPRVIQKLAGWSSLRMLERYGHTRDAEAIRAVSAVSSYLDLTTKTATDATDANSGSPEIPAAKSLAG